VSSLWVFPGQGAQQPGMLAQLPAEQVVRDCLDSASNALAEDVRLLDSAQALQSSCAVQLCLLIAGVAAARLLQARDCQPDYVAGLSIGAYPAAVISGALAFEDAVRLVALRGELMQGAYPEGYGMTAIIGLDQTRVEALIAQVHSAETPVHLANINADTQFVIAGSLEAMASVSRLAKASGAAAARRLAVTVPSHCELLATPARALADAFAQIHLQAPGVRYQHVPGGGLAQHRTDRLRARRAPAHRVTPRHGAHRAGTQNVRTGHGHRLSGCASGQSDDAFASGGEQPLERTAVSKDKNNNFVRNERNDDNDYLRCSAAGHLYAGRGDSR
jgi:malonate decarboxylase epsilon subunit